MPTLLPTLVIVTTATICHNYAGDRVWSKFNPSDDYLPLSKRLLWVVFTYLLPLLPLAFAIMGRRMDDASAMDLFTFILVTLMAILCSGVTASGLSFIRRSRSRRRVDGKWLNSLAEEFGSETMKLATYHATAGVIITIGWYVIVGQLLF